MFITMVASSITITITLQQICSNCRNSNDCILPLRSFFMSMFLYRNETLGVLYVMHRVAYCIVAYILPVII